jgi:hypothetical protein
MKVLGWMVAIALVVLVVIWETTRPPVVSWKPTYSPVGTQPYDHSAVIEAVKRQTYGTVSVYVGSIDSIVDDIPYEHTVVIVGDIESDDEATIDALLDHANGGGRVVLLQGRVPSVLDQEMGVRTRSAFSSDSSRLFVGKNAVAINAIDHISGADRYYLLDSATYTVYAWLDSLPVAVAVPHGEGSFVRIGCSDLLTNYGVLNKTIAPLGRELLASIIPRPQSTAWIRQAESSSYGNTTPRWLRRGASARTQNPTSALDIVDMYPSLKWALIVPCIAFLMYMANGVRHRQRPIPSLPRDVNTTVDFISTVADVYASKGGSHAVLALLIRNLRWYGFQHYRIQENDNDDVFLAALQRHVAASDDEIRLLRFAMAAVRSGDGVDDTTLVEIARVYNAVTTRTSS